VERGILSEILQLMAIRILRKIARNIPENPYFAIIADESTDQSRREQVRLVTSHVDCDLYLSV